MKHNLDTSILRPLLTSPRKVKTYYNEVLCGEKYITDYVRMEFLRGYIKSCINFYFLLSMPQYENVSDVLHIWSQKFGSREHKNIEIMIANLWAANHNSNEKEKLKIHLADYIRRLIGKSLYKFKNIGNDNTYCSKGKIKINFDPEKIDECFRDYLSILSNNEEYKNCKIESFIKNKFSSEIKQLISSKDLKLDVDNKGFTQLIKNLESISDERKITCAFCSKIGDCIISLLVDINGWSLEHTDYSFDYLCEILKKNHQRHPNDGEIMRREI